MPNKVPAKFFAVERFVVQEHMDKRVLYMLSPYDIGLLKVKELCYTVGNKTVKFPQKLYHSELLPFKSTTVCLEVNRIIAKCRKYISF